MHLLLDTCVLLWLAAEPKKISDIAQERMKQSHDHLYVSAISAFEISIKHKKKKLALPLDPWPWFEQMTEFYGINKIPISAKVAAMAPSVQIPHADPCDRIIVATAIDEELTVLTPDHLIHQCEQIQVVW